MSEKHTIPKGKPWVVKRGQLDVPKGDIVEVEGTLVVEPETDVEKFERRYGVEVVVTDEGNKAAEKNRAKTGTRRNRNSHPEIPKIFWRASLALQERMNEDPNYKEVWDIIFDEWDQLRANVDVFTHAVYDKREIIYDIDPVDTPNPQLTWIVSADNAQGTYRLKSLPSLLSKLKKNPPKL